jgi:hypothetical protein
VKKHCWSADANDGLLKDLDLEWELRDQELARYMCAALLFVIVEQMNIVWEPLRTKLTGAPRD